MQHTRSAHMVVAGFLAATVLAIPDRSAALGRGSARVEGTIILKVVTVPEGLGGTFRFTGVPTGSVEPGLALVTPGLDAGTYTTTMMDPEPRFDITDVRCDDGESVTPSSGDFRTRTAVLNVDPGETVTCTFEVTRRGTVVVGVETDPPGEQGTFEVTGVPMGRFPAGGTLVTTNLQPGTYTTTMVNPEPDFDVTDVACDDGDSAMPSSGDGKTRTAVFNADPAETVTCTFEVTRRGGVVVAVETDPPGGEGTFEVTGIPMGKVVAGGTLVTSNLPPGTYTTTMVDPEPEFTIESVRCDDGDSAVPSSGDAAARSAIFNVDPGELPRCTYLMRSAAPDTARDLATDTASRGGTSTGSRGGPWPDDARNPLDEDAPDDPGQMERFPLPDDMPAGASPGELPRAGPWSVTNLAGVLDCGVMSMAMPPPASAQGEISVLDGGRTLRGSGPDPEGGTTSLTLSADPEILGRYSGRADRADEMGAPIDIRYHWQVVTPVYIVGYLDGEATMQGQTCTIYRPYVLRFAG